MNNNVHSEELIKRVKQTHRLDKKTKGKKLFHWKRLSFSHRSSSVLSKMKEQHISFPWFNFSVQPTFFHCHRACAERGGMWKGAQLEQHSSSSATFSDRHFRRSRQLSKSFYLVWLHEYFHFFPLCLLCTLHINLCTFSQLVRTSARSCACARVFDAFPADRCTEATPWNFTHLRKEWKDRQGRFTRKKTLE